jgi:hypothetical protein
VAGGKARHIRCLRGRSKGEGMTHPRGRRRAREMRPLRGRGKSEGNKTTKRQREERGT